VVVRNQANRVWIKGPDIHVPPRAEGPSRKIQFGLPAGLETVIPGASEQLGPTASGNAEFTTSVTQFIDNFSSVKSRHSLKAGTDIRLQHLNVLQPPSPTGQFQFNNILTSGLTTAGTPVANTGNSYVSFLLGQVQNFTIDVQDEVLGPRATIAEFFVQDDWRVSERFSLNLGARYTLNFPSTVVDDHGAVFNLQTKKLDFLGENGFSRSARNFEKANFGPRVGLAFKLTESFVIRSGYGLTWIEQAGITTPFTTPLFPFIRTLGQRSLDNRTAAFVLSQGRMSGSRHPTPTRGSVRGSSECKGTTAVATHSNGTSPSRKHSEKTGALKQATWGPS
jgi:hypothetical protein